MWGSVRLCGAMWAMWALGEGRDQNQMHQGDNMIEISRVYNMIEISRVHNMIEISRVHNIIEISRVRLTFRLSIRSQTAQVSSLVFGSQ